MYFTEAEVQSAVLFGGKRLENEMLFGLQAGGAQSCRLITVF